MPKGYWIVNNSVRDPDGYEDYKAAAAGPMTRHGARFVVRGGQQTVVEDKAHPRSVVIEFPRYEAALACYDDPDYQAAKAIREGVAEGRLVIVEGYDG